MKPTEFSKRLGIPVSTVRYYDRQGITQSGRVETNNYRDFDARDALDIYNALMLKSFDVKLENIAETKFDIDDMDSFMTEHIPEVEERLRREELCLARVKEMHSYIGAMKSGLNSAVEIKVEESYAIWTLNDDHELSPCEIRNLALLSENFPYTYVCLGIDEEELLTKDKYKVKGGLGILRSNADLCEIACDQGMENIKGKVNYAMFLEKEDPFDITREDLEPIFTKAKKDGVTLKGNGIGRIYLRYRKNGKIVYGFSMGMSAVKA